jgi:ADP-heptose:LPS heptosyltransferase
MALSKLVVLRHRYPDVEFWVLTRDDSRQVFEACPLVSRVLTFPPGRITLATMAAEAMVAIRSAGLERVIVPLDGDSSGYENVLRVAAACGAERIVMLCPRNEEVAMDGILPEAS